MDAAIPSHGLLPLGTPVRQLQMLNGCESRGSVGLYVGEGQSDGMLHGGPIINYQITIIPTSPVGHPLGSNEGSHWQLEVHSISDQALRGVHTDRICWYA